MFLCAWVWMRENSLGKVYDLELAAQNLAQLRKKQSAAVHTDDEWTLPSKKRLAQKTLPEKENNPGEKCPPRCFMEGVGEYISGDAAFQKPCWIGNFIESSDYPRVAAEEGKDGKVILSVIIDREGRVRDAQMLAGKYEILNQVALQKVRSALFSPAYDKEGNPVACRVRVPILFQLR